MANVIPCTAIEIKVEPWTKEKLRALGARCFDFAAERSKEMFLVGRDSMGCAWGSRLPRIEAAIAEVAKLPYETGKDVDAVGAKLADLMLDPVDQPSSTLAKLGERALDHLYVQKTRGDGAAIRVGIDVGVKGDYTAMCVASRTPDGQMTIHDVVAERSFDRRDGESDDELRERLLGAANMIAAKMLPTPCSVCGRAVKRKRHVGRDGAVCCSGFCASDHGNYANPTSITGITRALLAASVEFAPIGISPRSIIAKVADHLGIEVDADDLRDR